MLEGHFTCYECGECFSKPEQLIVHRVTHVLEGSAVLARVEPIDE